VSPPRPVDFYTLGFHERGLQKALEEFDADQSLRLYVLRRGEEDTGSIIGAVNFDQFFRRAFQRCILGYSVDGACEGQGLLREALEAAIGYVFDELGFHRIEANHVPENLRSAGLLRRLGFDVQGYARDYLFIGGAWRDHVLNAKTNPKPMTP